MNLSKYTEYLITKLKILYKQKKYISNNCELKYILEKNNSDTLIVIFSACTRRGIKARYNYNKTLSNIVDNKLFILDDFGTDGRGVYYLGKNEDFFIEKTVNELIDKVINEQNIKRLIFIGSSKGGYAALYFGLERKNIDIICGGPQYYLGDYLKSTHPHILDYVMGKNDNKSVNYLNKLLEQKISNIKNIDNFKIHLHYSKNDHTYVEHIKYLIEELKSSKVKFDYQELSYKKHSDISKYFPSFIIESIEKIKK